MAKVVTATVTQYTTKQYLPNCICIQHKPIHSRLHNLVPHAVVVKFSTTEANLIFPSWHSLGPSTGSYSGKMIHILISLSLALPFLPAFRFSFLLFQYNIP
jgi:hypothetical protein